MTSIWQEHKPSGAGGIYLKLKDGDSIKVRFYSPPAVVTYDGEKLRYQVVLFNKTANTAQIYEFGSQIFGKLAELYDEWGEPGEFDLTIKRKGSGQFDTEYSVNPSRKSTDLTTEEQEACNILGRLFPGPNARLLTEYEKDHIMPEKIESKSNKPSDILEGGEALALEDMPPDL